MGSTRYRLGAWRQQQQEMSTGGYGISLGRDSVSKEFQSQIIVLGKTNTCIHQHWRPDSIIGEIS